MFINSRMFFQEFAVSAVGGGIIPEPRHALVGGSSRGGGAELASCLYQMVKILFSFIYIILFT